MAYRLNLAHETTGSSLQMWGFDGRGLWQWVHSLCCCRDRHWLQEFSLCHYGHKRWQHCCIGANACPPTHLCFGVGYSCLESKKIAYPCTRQLRSFPNMSLLDYIRAKVKY